MEKKITFMKGAQLRNKECKFGGGGGGGGEGVKLFLLKRSEKS